MELGQWQGVLGIVLIPLAAWLASENRRALSLRDGVLLVASGLGLQAAIAAAFLLLPPLTAFFGLLGEGVAALQAATNEGTRLVFGYLAGGDAPFEVIRPENGFVLALQALPLILLVSVLSQLLFYWGILQRIVAAFAWALRRTMGVTGALGTSTAANIFVGMVEAPLFIRPYLAGMGRGALFAMMTAGMATVAGTVLALYASLLEPVLPGAAGHLVIASVMSAPAAIMIARLMVPEGFARTDDRSDPTGEEAPKAGSAMDAIARGTFEGLRLLAYVAAMLVVMVALVALANQVLGALVSPFGLDLTVQQIVGWLLAPVAFAIGVPWEQAALAGELIGVKVVLNELLAFLQLAAAPEAALDARSRLILAYALCGFANFGSLGIMIGGLVAMCPQRRDDFLALGPKTIVSGTMATLLTGSIVGVLVGA